MHRVDSLVWGHVDVWSSVAIAQSIFLHFRHPQLHSGTKSQVIAVIKIAYSYYNNRLLLLLK